MRQEAGLRLDTGDLIRQGADSGPVIVAGKSDESLLVAAVTCAENRMPADAEPLSEAEIARLRRWIDHGAERCAASQRRPIRAGIGPFERPSARRFRLRARPAGWRTRSMPFWPRREGKGLAASAPADKAVLLRPSIST